MPLMSLRILFRVLGFVNNFRSFGDVCHSLAQTDHATNSELKHLRANHVFNSSTADLIAPGRALLGEWCANNIPGQVFSPRRRLYEPEAMAFSSPGWILCPQNTLKPEWRQFMSISVTLPPAKPEAC